MVLSKSDLSQRSLPYMRPSLGNVKADVVAVGLDAPVLKDLGNDLLVAYVVDLGDRLQYVQRRHLAASGISESELHSDAVQNLMALAREKLRVESHRGVFAVFLDGNFEASLILLHDLWDESLTRYVRSGFVAAIPVRDVLAFCDPASSEGITELRQVIARANSSGDHLLTQLLYRRQARTWVRYED